MSRVIEDDRFTRGPSPSSTAPTHTTAPARLRRFRMTNAVAREATQHSELWTRYNLAPCDVVCFWS